MFLSIALIIFVLVMVQIAMVFVGNYRFLAENWKREVFEEFASSVRRAIQRIGSADNEAVISMIADSSSDSAAEDSSSGDGAEESGGGGGLINGGNYEAH